MQLKCYFNFLILIHITTMNIDSPDHHFTPLKKKQSPFLKVIAGISVLGIMVGLLVGLSLINNKQTLTSQASSSTIYWTHDEGQTLSFDGAKVTVHDTGHQYQLKLVVYKANQPAWGPTWQAIGTPSVSNVSDGSTVEVPCGFFQADLIPQDATVYDSPSYTGDRYGYPGDDVLKAAVNGERTNCSASPTPTPETPTPTLTPTLTPTVTPTIVPECGQSCTTDASCPTNHSCNAGKCVLTKCLQPGVQCDTNKCRELACVEPPAVSNLKIVCPNCLSKL